MIRIRSLALAFCIASTARAQLLPSAPPDRCEGRAPAGPSAAEWLARAARTVLPPAGDTRVLRYRVSYESPLWEQSDRSYEPFLPNVAMSDRWFDPRSGVEGRQPITVAAVSGRYPRTLTTATNIFIGRDTTATAAPSSAALLLAQHSLNAWAVLREWVANAATVRVVDRCVSRDGARIVLAQGDDRLFLAADDAVPTRLDHTEPHYLWGQLRWSYLYSTWWPVIGGGSFPFASFSSAEGAPYERFGTTQGSARLVARDSAPRLDVPAAVPLARAGAIESPEPDTVRIGAQTFLLRNALYTHTVTLARDTVFLLDATTSEQRSRQDSTWIARLFPGKHPVVLVVTDLAWPHISGVRFWLARGATIVSSSASRELLQRVAARRFTLAPDAYERARATHPLRFVAVRDSLRLGGGALTVHALRGLSTEGAVGVWIAADRFVWAGDYVQDVSQPTPYGRDVARTFAKLGLAPQKIAAQHLDLTEWSALVGANPEPPAP